jgi:histone deacetylase 1/2
LAITDSPSSGEFFPGTGDVKDVGNAKGKNYSVNFPLQDGVDDESYKYILEKVIGKVMENCRPNTIFLQRRADSLSGDILSYTSVTQKQCGNRSNIGLCVQT